MGLIPTEFNDLPALLSEYGIKAELQSHESYSIYLLNESKVALNLIPLQNTFTPESLLSIQEHYQLQGLLLIQLWADVWASRKKQVLDRLLSLTGLNKRIHGRKTQMSVVNQSEADEFMQQYHLQGPAKARYKYALKYEGDIIAMATFSNSRLMKQYAATHRSAELIRFATKGGLTVVGGLTKLIRYHLCLHKLQDIMTYADRDWSNGQSYLSSGFTRTQIVDPIRLWIDPLTMLRYTIGRKSEISGLQSTSFIPAFNTGNVKFVLYLQNE